MSPMKPQTSITVQLIRDKDNTARDDLITIRQTSDYDVVQLSYKDRDNNSFREVRVTKDVVSAYFISLFHVMSYDTDPFVSVQVNFPAFPCILLKTSDLQYESLRQRLQSMLWFSLEQSFPAMELEECC